MNVHFGDGGIRFARSFLHPTFNHHHKEAFILKMRFFTLHFICVSYIQCCWKLIVEKVCDSLSFSFKLFIEALPLVIILDALKFCIESLFFCHPILCWCSTLKISWSFIILFMRWISHGFWSSLWVRRSFALKFQGLWLAFKCIEASFCFVPRFQFG